MVSELLRIIVLFSKYLLLLLLICSSFFLREMETREKEICVKVHKKAYCLKRMFLVVVNDLVNDRSRISIFEDYSFKQAGYYTKMHLATF